MLGRNQVKFMVITILAVVFLAGNWLIYNNFYKELRLAHTPGGFTDPPVNLGKIKAHDARKPAWVYVYEEELYVNYFGEDIIDVLDLRGNKIRAFQAKAAEGNGSPQGMYRDGDRLLVTDYENGSLVVFTDKGRLLDAYYETAEKRRIRPVSVAVYRDVMYITDVSINGWMAVFKDGEMIMEVAGDEKEKRLEFPYAVAVTDDGRVIVTDPAGGKVKVFNCSGWYGFDIPVREIGMENPQGVAIDGLGRIHIVDNGTGLVFVFDNSGKYLFKYGEGLRNPSNIAVDRENRVIYIANTEDKSISVWGY